MPLSSRLSGPWSYSGKPIADTFSTVMLLTICAILCAFQMQYLVSLRCFLQPSCRAKELNGIDPHAGVGIPSNREGGEGEDYNCCSAGDDDGRNIVVMEGMY